MVLYDPFKDYMGKLTQTVLCLYAYIKSFWSLLAAN